jgi:hypothetical protein
MPEDWREGVIIIIYKRGNKNCKNFGSYIAYPLSKYSCENYNSVSEKMVLNKVREEQYSFRDYRSLVDLIVTVRQKKR